MQITTNNALNFNAEERLNPSQDISVSFLLPRSKLDLLTLNGDLIPKKELTQFFLLHFGEFCQIAPKLL